MNTISETDSEKLLDVKGYGSSSCCGAGTYGDYMICEECGEHCSDNDEEEI